MENHLEIVNAPWGNRKSAFCSALLVIGASHRDWDLCGEDESAGWNGLDSAGLAFTGGEDTAALSFPMVLPHHDSGLWLWTMVDAKYVCYCLAAAPLLFTMRKGCPLQCALHIFFLEISMKLFSPPPFIFCWISFLFHVSILLHPLRKQKQSHVIGVVMKGWDSVSEQESCSGTEEHWTSMFVNNPETEACLQKRSTEQLNH